MPAPETRTEHEAKAAAAEAALEHLAARRATRDSITIMITEGPVDRIGHEFPPRPVYVVSGRDR